MLKIQERLKLNNIERGVGVYFADELLPEVDIKKFGKSVLRDNILKMADELVPVNVYKSGNTTCYDVQDLNTKLIYLGICTANMKKNSNWNEVKQKFTSVSSFEKEDVRASKQRNTVETYINLLGKDEKLISFLSSKYNKMIKVLTDKREFEIPKDLSEINKGLYFKENLKMMSLIQYGKEVAYEDLTCLITNESVIEWIKVRGIFTNTYELHHLLVRYGKSVLKAMDENTKPISPSTQMYMKPNKAFKKESFGITLIRVDKHVVSHAHGSNLDFRMFNKVQLPFVFRSEENYNYVVNKLDLQDDMPSYSDFLKLQTSDLMNKELINSDWI